MQPVQPAGGAESGLVEVRYRRGRDPFGRGGGESVEVVSTTIGISAGVPRRVGGAQAAVGVSVFDATDEARIGAAVAASARSLGELLH
ncbi:hypothetical protein [Rhodococcus sp. SJ-3]|uniref:hypothetical protein n=1 Tax=Rhodococcus sp. SJ-3 TaxID=3454628 RepID=UPI003F796CF8